MQKTETIRCGNCAHWTDLRDRNLGICGRVGPFAWSKRKGESPVKMAVKSKRDYLCLKDYKPR